VDPDSAAFLYGEPAPPPADRSGYCGELASWECALAAALSVLSFLALVGCACYWCCSAEVYMLDESVKREGERVRGWDSGGSN